MTTPVLVHIKFMKCKNYDNKLAFSILHGSFLRKSLHIIYIYLWVVYTHECQTT